MPYLQKMNEHDIPSFNKYYNSGLYVYGNNSRGKHIKNKPPGQDMTINRSVPAG
jgi:hypothetical protein